MLICTFLELAKGSVINVAHNNNWVNNYVRCDWIRTL